MERPQKREFGWKRIAEGAWKDMLVQVRQHLSIIQIFMFFEFMLGQYPFEIRPPFGFLLRDVCLMYLYFICFNRSFRVYESQFGIPHSNVSDCLTFICVKLPIFNHKYIHCTTNRTTRADRRREFMATLGTKPPNEALARVKILLDGNHTPIQKIDNTPMNTTEKKAKSKKNEKYRKNYKKWKNLELDCYSWHSYKLKQYAISHLLVVDLKGFVVYISPGHPASAPDVLFVKKYLREMLEALHRQSKSMTEWEEYDKLEVIFADKGYECKDLAHKYYIFSPYKGKQTDLTAEQKDVNEYINLVRSRIEHTFGKCGLRFEVLVSNFRWNLKYYDVIYENCYALHNIATGEKYGMAQIQDEESAEAALSYELTEDELSYINADLKYDQPENDESQDPRAHFPTLPQSMLNSDDEDAIDGEEHSQGEDNYELIEHQSDERSQPLNLVPLTSQSGSDTRDESNSSAEAGDLENAVSRSTPQKRKDAGDEGKRRSSRRRTTSGWMSDYIVEKDL